jgi:putative tryptophan/tyrosine transport system substrate-binding protein
LDADMRRREFISLFGGAATAWPLVARAQPSTLPVIGFLNNTTPETYAPFIAAFRRGLGQVGYIEGQNVAIEYRWGRNQSERLPDFAKELVQRAVTVIVASGGESPFAGRRLHTVLPACAFAYISGAANTVQRKP